MGILNVTPDSFYNGYSVEESIIKGKEIVSLGADILDVGGASARPGAAGVEEGEEIRRVVPVIKALRGMLPISIDTCKPGVARAAIEAGASLINDITGFTQPEMRALAAETGAEVCIMHMQGTPQTMQINPCYPEGVVEHIMSFFERQAGLLVRAGVAESRIILDPGIGFGKTVEHNVALLKAIPQFKSLGFRILIGASRKSFMAKILGKTTIELLPATLVMNTISLAAGADIIRVHDISEHRDAIDLLNFF